MEGGRQTAQQKKLATNQRVSGAVGNFIEAGPSKHCRHERWFGYILQAGWRKKIPCSLC